MPHDDPTGTGTIPAGEAPVPHADTDLTLPHPHARPCIIGFCGPENTGKDTTAEVLYLWMKKHYPAVKITSFAEPIYAVAATITGLSKDQLQQREGKERLWIEDDAPLPGLVGHSPRSILRDIGMWLRDKFGDRYILQHLMKRAKGPGWFLVTDVRLDCEAEMCDFVVEVRREGIEYRNDHRTSYRISVDLIDHTEHLTPGMDYVQLGQKLTRMIAEKQAQGLERA